MSAAERVREAREEVEKMVDLDKWHDGWLMDKLDMYAAAVRAEERARCVVTEAAMCDLRSAIVGRDADDDDRTPRYGMIRVKHLVEMFAALTGADK